MTLEETWGSGQQSDLLPDTLRHLFPGGQAGPSDATTLCAWKAHHQVLHLIGERITTQSH